MSDASKPSKSAGPAPASPARTRLTALATALRHFHSALLDVAKSDYEFAHGRIDGPFTLYSLVMNHPDFQWLRPLSGLMATLDEVLDRRELLTTQQVQDVRGALGLLFGSTDSRFAAFREGYEKAKNDLRARDTEARWRELLDEPEDEPRALDA